MIRNIFRVTQRARSLWWRAIGSTWAQLQGVKLGKGVRFLGLPIITMEAESRISIGDQAMLCSVSSHTALGVVHPVILRTLNRGAEIRIGAHAGISGASICSARSISIGHHVLLGANVVITDTDFHPLKPQNRRYEKDFAKIGAAAVSIGNNVFVGTGSIILKGTEIGDDSVIGAGSIVAGRIPAGVIAAGNPAKVIGNL